MANSRKTVFLLLFIAIVFIWRYKMSKCSNIWRRNTDAIDKYYTIVNH